MIKLTASQKKIVLEILQRYVPQLTVVVFGSRATEKYRETSDLDLALIGKEALGLLIYGELKEAFEESDLPMRVDIIDWVSISYQLRLLRY